MQDLLTPKDVALEFGIPIATQRVWKHFNRYGWRKLTIKLGGRVRYNRADIEAWIASRKGV